MIEYFIILFIGYLIGKISESIEIPSNSAYTIDNITTVKLNNGKLKDLIIYPWTRTLDLSNSNLSDLSPLNGKWFLSKIKNVKLNNNNLIAKSLSTWPNKLKPYNLDISYNKFMYLYYGTNRLPDSITGLRVSNNPLLSLLSMPTSVKSLGCSFTHITNFYGIVPNVTSIVAAFCKLNDISELQNISNPMNKLYLSYNYITELPKLPKIKILDVSCNLLIDSCINQLNNDVDELILSNNPIKLLYIPYINIKCLRLCKTHIEYIYGTLKNIKLIQLLGIPKQNVYKILNCINKLGINTTDCEILY